MRFGKLRFTGKEPFGEGSEKVVFVDPKNPNRVIAERKEDREKETLRQLKGRAYLTKIVHLLLPDHIPDVYQAWESREGKQFVSAQRIEHMPGHTHAQELRKRSNRTTQEEKEALEHLAGRGVRKFKFGT
jgi:hypothetical protein